MSSTERRKHPRLNICLPIVHRPAAAGAGEHEKGQDFTIDIAPGGVYFNLTGQAPDIGEQLHVELTVPPGEGYSPHGGKISGLATVLRRQQVPQQGSVPQAAELGLQWTVAARFDKPLNLQF